MSRFALFLCLTLFLASEGRSRRGNSALSDAPAGWGSLSLARYRDQGLHLYRRSQFLPAAQSFEAGYREALNAGLRHAASRFILNRANCRFNLSQYQGAVEDYLEAVELAGSEGLLEKMAAFVNLSSLYLELGDAVSARDSAQRGLEHARTAQAAAYRPHLLAQLARTRRHEDPAAAIGLLREALAESSRSGDAALAASLLDSLGEVYLHKLRDLSAAEAAYTEAFRLRKTLRLPDIEYSYLNLAAVRMDQGALHDAIRLSDAGLALSGSSRSLKPLWGILHQRGVVCLKLGRLREAHRDFERALGYVRRWRADMPAADAIRLSADVNLHFVYQSAIDTGNLLAVGSNDEALARRTFSVAEEHRAASLRARWKLPADWQSKLPPEYWEVLSLVRESETAALRDSSKAALDRLRALRLRLSEIEVRAGRPGGAEAEGGGDVSGRLQRSLRPSEALFAFETGEAASWLWAISAGRFRLIRLPGREVLAGEVGAFRHSVERGSADAESNGRRLFRSLFGQLDDHFLKKPDWILVLDDVLFEAPLAALVESGAGGRPRYLVESHSIRILPAALALLEPKREKEPGGLFVGLADPIYNRADPRWDNGSKEDGILPLFGLVRRSAPEAADALELPRLAASAAEVRSCAAYWRRNLLLEGRDATRGRLERAVAAGPDVLHLATHILRRAGRRDDAFIALSLEPGGRMDMLTPSSIAPLAFQGVVILNGCGSGQGRVLAGAGLLGLTRAWLSGGAKAVIATHWAMIDERGELWPVFYRALRAHRRRLSGPGCAAALQLAQKELIAKGGPRSNPSYWARYFAVGKE